MRDGERTEAPEEVFKRFCANVIRAYLARLGVESNVSVREHRWTEDGAVVYEGGRDIDIVIHSADLPHAIFGVIDKSGRYAVEIKYTANEVLSDAAVAPNLLRLQEKGIAEEIAGIIIITNARFPPRGYFRMHCANGLRKPRLIDGWTLRHLAHTSAVLWPEVCVPPAGEARAVDSSSVAVQHPTGRIFELTYVFHNRQPTERRLNVAYGATQSWVVDGRNDLGVARDVDWALSGQALVTDLIIPPWTAEPVRFLAYPQGEWLPEDKEIARNESLCLTAELIGEAGSEPLKLMGPARVARIRFRPPFVGTFHRQARLRLLDHIRPVLNSNASPVGLTVVAMQGAPGVGKSRVLAEVLGDFAAGGEKQFLTLTFGQLDGGGRAVVAEKHLQDFAKHAVTSSSRTAFEKCQTAADYISFLTQEQPTPVSPHIVPVLVLEDVHNAAPAELDSLKDALLWARAASRIGQAGAPLVVLIVGRNDDSFVNAAYSRVKNKLETEGVLAEIVTIPDLTEEETEDLIRLIIPTAPDSAVKAIKRLSLNRPQHVVQVVHYLLDRELVGLIEPARVAIIDEAKFAQKSKSLPSDMMDLLAKRFKNLTMWPDLGAAAQEALLAAAVYGTAVPTALLDRLAPKKAADLLAGLETRGYLRQDGAVLAWSHESLLLFFRNRIRDTVQRRVVAPKEQPDALGTPLLSLAEKAAEWNDLPSLWPGAFAALVGRKPITDAVFADLISYFRSQGQYSSQHRDREVRYYPFVEYALLDIVNRPHRDRSLLIYKLLVGKAAMGAFMLSLAEGHQAYAFGQSVLEHARLSAIERERIAFWLDQIIAHVEHDSGQTGRALPKLLKLQNRLAGIGERLFSFEAREADGPTPEEERLRLSYDLYNSLRLCFDRSNYPDVSSSYGLIADQVAGDADRLLRQRFGVERNEDLPATEQINLLEPITYGDQAFQYHYPSPTTCLRINEVGSAACRAAANTHHIVHYTASIIACQIPMPKHRSNSKWLSERDAEVIELIADCQERQQPALPRLYLLRAGLTFLRAIHADNPEDRGDLLRQADRLIQVGIDRSLELAVGYVSWQLNNIAAMIAARRAVEGPGQHRAEQEGLARRHLLIALEKIEAQGLLFMGDQSMASAVPLVIANAVKRLDESTVLPFIARIHGIQPYAWHRPEAWLKLRETAHKHHHCIIGQRRVASIITDPETKLALTCWL